MTEIASYFISMMSKKFIITSIFLNFYQKKLFLQRWPWFNFNVLELVLGKKSKTKIHKVLRANFYFGNSKGEQ